MLAHLRSSHSPGGALALIKDGRLILIRGYGFADREKRVPVKPETAFGLGSASKTITAVGILHLVDQGKLKLTDKVAPFLSPLAPPRARLDPRIENVTVLRLLNHSSGLPRDISDQELTADEQIQMALSQPLSYQPGEKAVYSNLGYTFLGYIISRASGETYETYMKKSVLRPMGITRARLPGDEVDYQKDEARHYGTDGQLLSARIAPAPATGGWAFSALDLARFMASLYGPKGKSFLSAAMMRQMVAPPEKILLRKNGNYYGLGWDKVERTRGGLSLTKNGELGGIHAELGHVAGGAEFVLLFNGGSKKLAPWTTRKLFRLIHEQRSWPALDLFKS